MCVSSSKVPTSMYKYLLITCGCILLSFRSIATSISNSKSATVAAAAAGERCKDNNNDDDDNNNTPIVLFYPQNPKKFNDILLDCRDDPTCHLMYHHVPKTGGTLIGSRLHPLFDPNGRRYKSREWCCYERFMDDHFKGNEVEYCTKRGINILELWGHEFHHVLQTCQEKKFAKKKEKEKITEEAAGNNHRYVALISTREPIQRTLSLIHQQCNSGFDTKNSRYQSFCKSCVYDDDKMSGSKRFFNQFSNETNQAYETMKTYFDIHNKNDNQEKLNDRNSSSLSSISQIPFLVIDTIMLTDFFQELQQALIDRHVASGNDAATASVIVEGISNPENRSICNFGMTSPFLKELKSSISIYFDLWQGII